MNLPDVLNFLIFPGIITLISGIFGFGFYLIKQLNQIKANQNAAPAAKSREIKLLDEVDVDVNWLHDKFVTKEVHFHSLGEIQKRLDDIFKKLDELNKAVAYERGVRDGKEVA